MDNKITFKDIVNFVTFINCLKTYLSGIQIGDTDDELTAWDALKNQTLYIKLNNIIEERRKRMKSNERI